jgi:hypothetical protein
VLPLLDVPDDLRAAVLAEFTQRAHLGEHLLHRAAPDVADGLVAAPARADAGTTLSAGRMTIAALRS